jgi:hypothetical protein
MQHARRRDLIDEAAAAGEQRLVPQTMNRHADE